MPDTYQNPFNDGKIRVPYYAYVFREGKLWYEELNEPVTFYYNAMFTPEERASLERGDILIRNRGALDRSVVTIDYYVKDFRGLHPEKLRELCHYEKHRFQLFG